MNAINQNGCTPLYYTAFKNRQEIIVMLPEDGTNPDAKDHYEATAMHKASAKGNNDSDPSVPQSIHKHPRNRA